ncbi:dephospho-CoA kinase [Candidatus Kaiserbacteria bacterium]|nr:dephospho-CoA kinase [Candidatus Kaiserbacteria bacterium]
MILGITGTIGAGKGTIVEYLKKKGFKHVSASGFLAQEAARRGLAATRIVRREIGNEYRKRGAIALIEAVLAEVNPTKENLVVESLHTVAEVEYVRYLGGKVISVDAPLPMRWERIKNRNGEKDSVSYEAFVREQDRQMASNDPNENNLRAAMEVADYRVENTGSPEELFEKVNVILEESARTPGTEGARGR